MKIRFLRPQQGKKKYYKKGHEYELPEVVAQKYIMNNYAMVVSKYE